MTSGSVAGAPAVGRLHLLAALGALSAFGPLALDMYLPALPDLARSLDASDALGQLTMSACMVGLAAGQVVAGPLSDRLGRRRPLLVGVALFAASAAGCAVAPDIAVLLVLRLLTGLGGAAGLVIARAMVRDLHHGREAARIFSLIIAIAGVAPIAAPVLGSQLLRVTDWRGVFLVLGAVGAALLLTAATLPETLPPARRRVGAGEGLGAGLARVGRDPAFRAHAAVLALGLCGMFAYISLGSFVLERGFGLSAQAYGLVFAVNAAGIVAAGNIGARAIGRIGPAGALAAGVGTGAAGAALLLAATLLGAGLAVILPALFLVVASVGLIAPNATALGLERHGADAGAASALLGLAQFLVGAVVPPVASAGGATRGALAWTVAGCSAGAVAAAAVAARRRRAQDVGAG